MWLNALIKKSANRLLHCNRLAYPSRTAKKIETSWLQVLEGPRIVLERLVCSLQITVFILPGPTIAPPGVPFKKYLQQLPWVHRAKVSEFERSCSYKYDFSNLRGQIWRWQAEPTCDPCDVVVGEMIDDSGKPAPVVQVIMAARNSQDWIEEAIESILAQTTFGDFELYIVVNASSDGTLAIARAAQGRDGRVRVLVTEKAGVSNARNMALVDLNHHMLPLWTQMIVWLNIGSSHWYLR